ncbi:hypothetical protein BCR44DRAFT_1425385 [Catenaria anguillulae PL171]|uniref:Threonine/serine exporter-like N-terminal domain-containing protein n=1 Tax=Catenaria anguillulae PL171 TaxID=765915 RepID=A0A1Y2I520_9FUNG|nr:hypothetical protein BCR44DRAFT_1425385 [Catenaria anguillulae PL171]
MTVTNAAMTAPDQLTTAAHVHVDEASNTNLSRPSSPMPALVVDTAPRLRESLAAWPPSVSPSCSPSPSPCIDRPGSSASYYSHLLHHTPDDAPTIRATSPFHATLPHSRLTTSSNVIAPASGPTSTTQQQLTPPPGYNSISGHNSCNNVSPSPLNLSPNSSPLPSAPISIAPPLAPSALDMTNRGDLNTSPLFSNVVNMNRSRFPTAAYFPQDAAGLVPPEQLAHYNQAKAFVMKLGRALFSFGLPSFRLETDLGKAAAALGLTASFGVLPSSLQACFEHPWGLSEATMVNLSFGIDVGRLFLTNQLLGRLSRGDIDLEQATALLEDIIQNGNFFSRPWILFAFTIGSFAGAPLAFDGGWLDAIASAVLGFIVGGMNLAMAATPLGPLFEFSASFVVGFFTLAAQTWVSDAICFKATALSALLVPLPGLWISTSFIEISSRQIVSGTSRLWWAFMIAFQLALGLSLGFGAYSALPGPMWAPLFLPMISFSLNVLLNAHLRQFLPMTISTVVSYVLFFLCTLGGFTLETTSLLVSFVIGVETMLTGIMLLVPGSVATRYTVSLLDSRVASAMNSGIEVAARFIAVALAISVGQIAARIVDGVDIQLEPRRDSYQMRSM